ncbi:MAG: zinc ABC transporter substrate-binding protein [Paracoccaceae bacterium]
MSIPSCWLSRGLALIALALCPAVTRAGVPEVQADIAPVHSLVARVMAGVGEPGLIVDAGASPHSFALRPSQARALQDADLVFWVGPELEPWLSDAMITLTEDAVAIALFDAPETRRLAAREAALFDGDHDHDHDHDQGDDHAEAQDDDHAEGHDHGADDPHAWLDPENAIAWLGVIAEALAGADPAMPRSTGPMPQPGRARLPPWRRMSMPCSRRSARSISSSTTMRFSISKPPLA